MAAKTTQTKRSSPSALLRERKIQLYQEQIRQNEVSIAHLEEGRARLSGADLIGLPVSHRSFGAGTIVQQAPDSITVAFPGGEKRFLMPAAFTDGFLSTADVETNRNLARYQELGAQIRAAKNAISTASRSIRILEGS